MLELCGDCFDEVGPSFEKIVGIECFGCSVFESDFYVYVVSLPLDSLIGGEV